MIRSFPFTAFLCMAAVVANAAQTGEEFTRPLGFALVRTTLGDVQKKLGPAEMKEAGDAGGYEATVCYVVPDTKVLLIFKSGELGGNTHDLLGFSMRLLSDPPPMECLRLGISVTRTIDLSVGGLRLGMSREEFEKVLGKTEVNGEGALARVFNRRERLSPERVKQFCVLDPSVEQDPYYDVQIFVDGRFANKKLIEVSVWKTETL